MVMILASRYFWSLFSNCNLGHFGFWYYETKIHVDSGTRWAQLLQIYEAFQIISMHLSLPYTIFYLLFTTDILN